MVALGSFWLTYVQYKVLFYWWLQIALGISVAALVSMLVLPITAGAPFGTAHSSRCSPTCWWGLKSEETWGILARALFSQHGMAHNFGFWNLWDVP